MMSRILVIDDDKEMGSMLKDFLGSLNFEIITFTSAALALESLLSLSQGKAYGHSVDLIITDLRMPGMDGLQFIEKCKADFPSIPIILITAFGSIQSAIDVIKKGAFDYVVKPFKLSEIEMHVQRALQFANLKKQNLFLRKEFQNSYSFAGIIGKSESMQSVFDLIQRVAPSSANILIQGESGTGKELVAKAIHQQGSRADKRFVAINVTAIPESLLESELFGHEKGSFTGALQRKKGLFEEAQGGTLFLDEIGDMDLHLQSKLLRALQEKKIKPVGSNQDIPVDVRIIAATHKDLKVASKDGRFREDLYYRLSVIPILLPALRFRTDDIPLLAQYFLDKYNAINGTQVQGFTPEALQVLVSLPWDGNVRELENVIERSVILCRNKMIQVEDLPKSEGASENHFYAQVMQDLPTLEDMEKKYMQFVLNKTGGRKEKAAHILGINRRTLYRKERDYGWASPEEENLENSHHSSDENQ
ncbi:MAG: sigma-54-dependent transcriptional regulator [Pseudobdellovibrionaceae bacterium]